MTSLKLIHTSDFHLGAGLREIGAAQTLTSQRYRDFLRQLDAIREHALSDSVDFLIVAGDVFHTARPNSYLFDEFAKFIRTLTLKGVKVVCVAGNHDQPRATETESYMKALMDAGAPDFHFFKHPGICVLQGLKSGRKIRFVALPYLSPQMMREPEFTGSIQRTYSRLKDEEKSPFDFTVAVSHLYIEGAKLGSEQRLATLNDYPLPRSVLLDRDVDFVALGHIHTPQFLTEKMAYSGSIERVDFGEEGETKGILLLEEQGGGLKGRFIGLQCRPLSTLPTSGKPYDLVEEADPAAALASRVTRETIEEGSILRVLVRLGPRQQLPMNVLDRHAKEKRLLHWFLQYERLTPQRARDGRKGLPIREFYSKHVEAALATKTSRETVNLVVKEGLRIIDEVESEKAG